MAAFFLLSSRQQPVNSRFLIPHLITLSRERADGYDNNRDPDARSIIGGEQSNSVSVLS